MIVNYSCRYSPWNWIKHFVFRNNTWAMNATVAKRKIEDETETVVTKSSMLEVQQPTNDQVGRFKFKFKLTKNSFAGYNNR